MLPFITQRPSKWKNLPTNDPDDIGNIYQKRRHLQRMTPYPNTVYVGHYFIKLLELNDSPNTVSRSYYHALLNLMRTIHQYGNAKQNLTDIESMLMHPAYVQLFTQLSNSIDNPSFSEEFTKTSENIDAKLNTVFATYLTQIEQLTQYVRESKTETILDNFIRLGQNTFEKIESINTTPKTAPTLKDLLEKNPLID